MVSDTVDLLNRSLIGIYESIVNWEGKEGLRGEKMEKNREKVSLDSREKVF